MYASRLDSPEPVGIASGDEGHALAAGHLGQRRGPGGGGGGGAHSHAPVAWHEACHGVKVNCILLQEIKCNSQVHNCARLMLHEILKLSIVINSIAI